MTFAINDDFLDVHRLTGTLADGKTIIILRNATREMTERLARVLSRGTAFHDLRIEPDYVAPPQSRLKALSAFKNLSGTSSSRSLN